MDILLSLSIYVLALVAVVFLFLYFNTKVDLYRLRHRTFLELSKSDSKSLKYLIHKL